MPRTRRSESAVGMSFADRTSFPSPQYRRIADFIGQRILSHTSFPYCGSEKSYWVTVRPNRFPASITTAKTEVVVVTASFVTPKTYLGNLGWSFSTTYTEQRVRLENISSVQGNIILCEKLKTNLCGKLRNNNRCKIVSLSHAFATKY